MNIKYPRTTHLPCSESATDDDLWSSANVEGKEVVITEKLDGENTGMNNKNCHARSLDSRHHPSRSWVKQLHSIIKADIPEGWKIFGENLFAYHSILYLDLPSYFMCFGIYNDSNICISWDETVEFCQLLGLDTVPVLYRGVYDKKILKEIWNGKGTYPTYTTSVDYPQSFEDFEPTVAEGYVVRTAASFPYDEFGDNVAKYVRKNHVKPNSGHWASKPVTPNVLLGSKFTAARN